MAQDPYKDKKIPMISKWNVIAQKIYNEQRLL